MMTIHRLARFAVVLSAVFLCWGGGAVAQDEAHKARFSEAMAAYDAGDYALAMDALGELADRGHSGAETMLGVMHYRGLGVAADPTNAAIWFFKAARRGNANAQLAFASLYLKGEGVARAPEKALMWLLLARQGGTPAVVARAGTLLEKTVQQVSGESLAEAEESARLFQPMEALDR